MSSLIQMNLILNLVAILQNIRIDMTALRRLFCTFVALLCTIFVGAKTVYDMPDSNLQSLFKAGKSKYVLRYAHQFSDTLIVPYGSVIVFEGGKLSGPVFFNNTKLIGKVNLNGSSINGSIRNKTFYASWLCAMDGVTDDAPRINEMIEVCDNVYFPKGTYRLVSAYNAKGKVSDDCLSGIKSHIGVNRSNVSLIGEPGTIFLTSEPLGTISVFSQPNAIDKSVRNIRIENITFDVRNDGKSFHEFMHTIKLMGVNGITIKNCSFNDFWGDAICLSHYGDNSQTGERTRNLNVKILYNTIVGGNHHSNRNGISVINGKDVLIKGNIIKKTSRKDMPGGIDIEPNNSAYTIENIQIEKNQFDGCRGTAGAIGITMLGEKAPGHHIFIKSNVIKNCTNGIGVAIKTEGTTSHFVIQNNYIAEDTKPYCFSFKGKSNDWTISGNTFERPCSQEIPGDITVTSLVVKNNKKKE